MAPSSIANLRTVSDKSSRLEKACQFRLNAALAAVKTTQATHNAEKTDESRAALTQALNALTTAKAELADAKAQAETAKTDVSASMAARPHRAHKTTLDDVERTETVPTDSYYVTLRAFIESEYSGPFPAPPAAPCGKPACLKSKASRALDACPCNIKAAFATCTPKEAKMFKAAFANDNFSDASDKAKAEEVRDGLNSMLQKHAVNESLAKADPNGSKNKNIQQTSRKGQNSRHMFG